MKLSYREIYRSGGFIALLIAMLGFTTACRDCIEYGAVMYGTPSADYQIKAKVVDSSEIPLRNIRVTFRGSNDEQFTDSLGCAEFKFRAGIGNIYGSFEDIDGSANGGEWASIIDREFEFYQDQYTQYPQGQGGEWNNDYLNTEIKVVMRKKK